MNVNYRILEREPSVIAYGCAAHQLNLLAKDLQPDAVIKELVTFSYFLET